MSKRLSRWGVGPRIVASSLPCLVIAGLATHAWPNVFVISVLPQAVVWTGLALIAMGLALWLWGAACVMHSYNRDELRTTGPCGLVRHPIYAAWISLIFPGLVLATRSWAMILPAVVALFVFRKNIHVEDEYLTARFGEKYLEYRARVNELLPIPRAGGARPRRKAAGTGT